MFLFDLLLGRTPLRFLPVLMPLRGTGDEYDGGTGIRVLLKDGVGLIIRGLTVSDAGGVAAGDALRINGDSTVARCTAITDRCVGAARAAAANGAAVDVVLMGTVIATADGAVSAGDACGPTTTAGRWVTRNPSSNGNIVTATGAVTNVNADDYDGVGSSCGAACDGTCLRHADMTAVSNIIQGSGAAKATDMIRSGSIAAHAITAAGGAGSAFTLLIAPGGL